MTDFNSIHSGSKIDNTISSSIIKVANKAEAITHTPVAGQTMYILSADGRGNIWRAVTGAAASTYSDDGGSYCGAVIIPSGGDGSAAWIRDYNGGVEVIWFGVFALGLIFEDTELDNAIAYIKTLGGGHLHIQAGILKKNAQSLISTPIILYGDGDGSDVATSSTLLGTTTISCTAVGGAFLVKSATANQFLNGVQIKAMLLDCNNLGAIGLHLSSVGRGFFDLLTVIRCTNDGILLDDNNGVVSTYNHFGRYRYEAGAHASAIDSNGIRFHSTYSASLGGAVQSVCENITTNVQNGAGIKFSGSDNNIIVKSQGFVTGTGYALDFANGAFRESRNNLVMYHTGPVHAGSNSWGNRILNMTSEQGSVTVDAGGHLHYNAHHQTTGEMYSTHLYKMSDEYSISSSQMFPDGANAVHAIHALRWASIAFPNGVTGTATVNIPAPYSWGAGDIVAIEFIYSSDTANTTDNFRIRLELSADGDGDTTATSDTDESFDVAVNDSINRINKHQRILTTPVAYTRDDIITLRMQRVGGDGADTAAGDLELLGIKVIFEADGPNAGDFDIPPPYI